MTRPAPPPGGPWAATLAGRWTPIDAAAGPRKCTARRARHATTALGAGLLSPGSTYCNAGAVAWYHPDPPAFRQARCGNHLDGVWIEHGVCWHWASDLDDERALVAFGYVPPSAPAPGNPLDYAPDRGAEQEEDHHG